MDYRGVALPVLGGTVLALALSPFTLPVLSIGAGALATVALARRLEAGRHYALVGTLFYAVLAFVVPAITVLPPVYGPKVRYLLGGFALLSGLAVAVREGVAALLAWLGGLFGDEGLLAEVWSFLASVAGAGYLLWSLVRAKERTIRSVVIGVALPVSFTVNVMGHVVEFGVATDALRVVGLAVFVGLVAVGFHTLQSWYHLLQLRHDPTVRAAGARTKTAASTAGEKTREAAAVAGEKTREAAAVTGEKASAAAGRSTEAAREAGETVREAAPTAGDGAADREVPQGRLAGLMARLLGLGRDDPEAASE